MTRVLRAIRFFRRNFPTERQFRGYFFTCQKLGSDTMKKNTLTNPSEYCLSEHTIVTKQTIV